MNTNAHECTRMKKYEETHINSKNCILTNNSNSIHNSHCTNKINFEPITKIVVAIVQMLYDNTLIGVRMLFWIKNYQNGGMQKCAYKMMCGRKINIYCEQ